MQIATKVITSWLPSITLAHYRADQKRLGRGKRTQPGRKPQLPVRIHKHQELCYRLWWVDRADSRVPHAEKSPCFPLTADSHRLLSELYRKPLVRITPRPRFPNGKSILQFDDTLQPQSGIRPPLTQEILPLASLPLRNNYAGRRDARTH